MDPQWFTDAVQAPYQEHQVTVDGCPIHYLSWGDPAKPGLVLIHGGMAHAHWWRFLAPLLTSHYYVVAPDLSGHGDSGYRDQYHRTCWADEIIGVCEHANFVGKPVIVGHSMGGIVALAVASLYSDGIAGAVVVDAPLYKPPTREPESSGGRRTFRFMKPYPTLEKAISRFRLLPDQPCDNHFLIQFLAESSLKKVEDGYIWKFDMDFFEKTQAPPYESLFPTVNCPWIFLRGEHSSVALPETEAWLNGLFGKPMPFMVIPNTHHHLVLDQPLAFISTIRTVLELWGHRR